ncbi:MAG: 16S rRNA (guanine(527)-N(7))-methyltransferase RsmG [Thermodesulfobacteriota bacterium]|nr:16S rRNA (guanine(527)-N(7))-methyltransferase RsmG [Thermodesulfobacteriota bacterium]
MNIGSEQWKKLLEEGAANLNIHIDQKTTDQFSIHATELIKWNRKINLTTITDPVEVAVKHFLDSIISVRVMPEYGRLLDIGSGGGFPGIPIKIMIPSLSVSLIDASRKKISFLKHIIRNIKLIEINARHVRAEELAKENPIDNCFDVIICRAFSRLDKIIFQALPLLAKNGIIIAMKGKLPESELESAGKYNLSLTVEKYKLPFLELERSLVILKLNKLCDQ